MRLLLLLLAIMAQVGLALPAQADPLSKGRQMAEAFLSGEVGTVWGASAPDMQKVFGSIENLAAFREELLSTFGTEEAVLSERAEEQVDHDVFTRLSRWTGAPKMELVMTFDEAERVTGFVIRPQPVAAPSDHLDYQTKARLLLPFSGEWHVYWGGRDIEDNYHAADVGQRFALDLLVLQDRKSHEGDPTSLDSYHCWGRPILAPAEGVVVHVKEDLPDQPIGSADAMNPAGNHVVIDFGNDEFGFLAHLQQNSIGVAEGDRVTAGQAIGHCGNSGNTSEPHLHFHLQTSPRLDQGYGLPAQFVDYLADGEPIDRGEPRKGENIRPVE